MSDRPSLAPRDPDAVTWGTWAKAVILIILLAVGTGIGLWWAFTSPTSMGGMSGMSGMGGPSVTDGPMAMSLKAQPFAQLEAGDFHALLIDQQYPTNLFFGSHDGIQQSSDEGRSWDSGPLVGTDAMQLTSSPAAPDLLYATGHDVFQISRDHGQTWSAVATPPPGGDVHAFAQDTLDPARLFASVMGDGVWTSADGGMSWTALELQPPVAGPVIALTANAGILYAASETGLVKSETNGTSWIGRQLPSGSPILSLASLGTASTTIYAGTSAGLLRSDDKGVTWTLVGPSGIAATAIAISASVPDQVVIMTERGTLYRSDDRGHSWR